MGVELIMIFEQGAGSDHTVKWNLCGIRGNGQEKEC